MKDVMYRSCAEMEEYMVFGVLLAGGVGSRMGNIEKPKQYLNIADRPIIIHTIEKFFVNETFEKIIVLCPEQWISHTKNLVKKYIGQTPRIAVIAGGERSEERRVGKECT